MKLLFRKNDSPEKRFEKGKKRSYWLSIILTVFFWIFLYIIVFFVDPDRTGAVFLFFFTLFLALFFTSSIVLVKARRGLILALIIVLYMFLRFLGIKSPLNLVFMLGIGVAIEIYFLKK